LSAGQKRLPHSRGIVCAPEAGDRSDTEQKGERDYAFY
jgi:hypothetical protein